MIFSLLKKVGAIVGGTLLLLLLGLLLSAAAANRAANRLQAPMRWAADSATVVVAAGPQYAAGSLWCALWGQHHRHFWTTPVTAPVLHLGRNAPGGLYPVQAGGSHQSRSLRLRSDDGRQFVLRSVDKDASQALPTGWLRRLLGSLMRDQTSAGLPYGAYVAAQLADAAGVLHTNPKLFFVGDDAALGPYRATYRNALYLLEERPSGDQRHAATLGFSPCIISSDTLLAALHRRQPSPATSRAYLRARLLDIWLGDWSRRADQWRWATFPAAADRTEYRPIPRDRDQAFHQLDDGFYPWLIAQLRPRYQSFHAHISAPNVADLAKTARPLDLLLLRGLPINDFVQEAEFLQRHLTDAQIDAALRAGPVETRVAIAQLLRPRLVQRRAQLKDVAQWLHAELHTD